MQERRRLAITLVQTKVSRDERTSAFPGPFPQPPAMIGGLDSPWVIHLERGFGTRKADLHWRKSSRRLRGLSDVTQMTEVLAAAAFETAKRSISMKVLPTTNWRGKMAMSRIGICVAQPILCKG